MFWGFEILTYLERQTSNASVFCWTCQYTQTMAHASYFVLLLMERISTKIRQVKCESIAEVPNLGYIYPQEYIFLSERVHLKLAIEEKNIVLYYFYILHIY